MLQLVNCLVQLSFIFILKVFVGFVCLRCLAFPLVQDSLTEACTWRASGGGSPESWRGGRPWRTKVAAPSAPSPKPLEWTLQTRQDWIELCQKVRAKEKKKKGPKWNQSCLNCTELSAGCGNWTESALCWALRAVSVCVWLAVLWGQGPWGQTDTAAEVWPLFIQPPLTQTWLIQTGGLGGGGLQCELI